MKKSLEDDLLNTVFSGEIEPYGGLGKGILDIYYRSLKEARTYRMDEDATAFLTELATNQDMIPKYRRLARVQHDVVWLEFPHSAAHEMRLKLGTVYQPAAAEELPVRVGYLLRRLNEECTLWSCDTFTSNRDGKFGIFPLQHIVSTYGPVPPMFYRPKDIPITEIHLNQNSPALMAAWGMSKTAGIMGANEMRLSPGFEHILRRRQVLAPKPPSEMRKEIFELLEISLRELQGDLRWICAALATINELPYTLAGSKPSGVLRARGRLQEYLVNRTVVLKIPGRRTKKGIRYSTTVAKKLLNAAHREMKRHEVRGHWRIIIHKKDHYRRMPNPDGRSFTKVLIEAGTREEVWITPHERGNAELGYVIHDYVVQKGDAE